MFNEEEFKNKVIELVTNAKHQRDGVALELVSIYNLSGKHTVTRKIKALFGITLAEMLKMRFSDAHWVYKIPGSKRTPDADLYTRINELRLMSSSYQEAKKQLLLEFNITEMELLRRARSLFQKTLSEVFEPTYEEAVNALIRANTAQEFREILGLATNNTAGVFQKYFKVSNFVSAKANIISKQKVSRIVPNTNDNEAIVFSQVLGDGHYDSYRKSLRITHGIKQLDYLKLKVSLLKNAYPELADISDIKVRIHTQGHEYCDWYSKKLPEHIYSKLDSFSKLDMVDSLTPLGWYLWYLDDGNLHIGETPSCSISGGIDTELHNRVKAVLSTYNINGNSYTKQYSIQKRVEISKFLNTFIKPFEHITPACMLYKTQFMI